MQRVQIHGHLPAVEIPVKLYVADDSETITICHKLSDFITFA